MPVIFQPPSSAAVWTTTTLDSGARCPSLMVTRKSCHVRVASIGAMRSKHPVSTSW